jgi:hypothetical protein
MGCSEGENNDERTGLKNVSRCSLIEINKMVHAFFLLEIDLSRSDNVYATLKTLSR